VIDTSQIQQCPYSTEMKLRHASGRIRSFEGTFIRKLTITTGGSKEILLPDYTQHNSTLWAYLLFQTSYHATTDQLRGNEYYHGEGIQLISFLTFPMFILFDFSYLRNNLRKQGWFTWLLLCNEISPYL